VCFPVVCLTASTFLHSNNAAQKRRITAIRIILFFILIFLLFIAAAISQSPPTIPGTFTAFAIVNFWNSTTVFDLEERIWEDGTNLRQRFDTILNGTEDHVINRYDQKPATQYVVYRPFGNPQWQCKSDALTGTLQPWFAWLSQATASGSCSFNLIKGTEWTLSTTSVTLRLCYDPLSQHPLIFFIRDTSNPANAQNTAINFQYFAPGPIDANVFTTPANC